jgi:carbon-monoxide dehydrogenase medium subunit
VKPPRFAYHAPTSVAEALDVLAEHGDESKVLAGGQSLFPILNFRLAEPENLVDINRLPGLDTIERTASGWRIPALVRQRHAERSSELAAEAPLLTDALYHVAHPQIRNRGTICGSLAHGDASAELPTVMTALDARMTIASKTGTRTVPAGEFFVFHLTTAVEPDELLLAVEFDRPAPGTAYSFQEFAKRKGDFCLAAAAAVINLDPDGAVARCRIVVAGVAPTPLRLRAVEAALLGEPITPRALVEAARVAAQEINPTGDVHADAAYRRQLSSVLVRRALEDATTRPEHRHAA